TLPPARVAFLGDVNGDKIGDLAITITDASSSRIVFGGGLAGDMDLDALLDSGRSVVITAIGPHHIVPAGDLDGDGIADFAVGSGQPPGDHGFQGPGEIAFVRGRTTWPRELRLEDPDAVFSRIVGSKPNHGLALDIAAVGDVNGDGLPDI